MLVLAFVATVLSMVQRLRAYWWITGVVLVLAMLSVFVDMLITFAADGPTSMECVFFLTGAPGSFVARVATQAYPFLGRCAPSTFSCLRTLTMAAVRVCLFVP